LITSAPELASLQFPRADLRETPWFAPRTISILNKPIEGDQVQAKLLPKLIQAFRAQGHTVLEHADGNVNLMIGFYDVPDTDAPLLERIPERELPLALTIMREYKLARRPDNLVLFLTIRERPSEMKHMQVVELSRTAMARSGSPKVVFLSGDRKTGELWETTYTTLEGGHPSDRAEERDVVAMLRDRLISMACARDVGADYIVVDDAISKAQWENTRTPEAIIAAGHRMDQLNLLPAPKNVSEYVSPELANIYNRYLNMKGFSEGMLFAFDPDTDTLMVTASGSWNVDKRALKREEVVPIGGMQGHKILVYAPEGVKPKGPSVEAVEMYTLLMSVPKTRVSKKNGVWVADPNGEKQVPMIRGGVHTHVGVTHIDEEWVEDMGLNRRDYPYGFGCGTDLMKQLAQDAAHRSKAIHDPTDPRVYVRWQMLYHGETVVELWKPGASDQPLQGLLDMYDPQRVGAIEYTYDHIDQP
jgi:hypothetical protein